MTEAVSWDLAERVAVRVAGREPFAESYHYSSLQPDFEELTVEAEELVARATGLRSLAGPARARVTDRPGWVRANVASFQRLLRPVTERLGPRLLASPIAPVSRAAAGVQVGTVLGWMSTRVLGQYDLLLAEDERVEEQDIVYYVGPNVLSLEKRFSFPPRQFRLWLALHEVTHRAQFTGIPWMRGHFLSLVDQTLGAMDPDPRRFLEGLRRAADEVRMGRNPLSDGGLLGLVMGTEQHAVLGKVQGLMSLLEGHGDVTMDRAGAARIPSAERFSRVLRDRRRQVRGPARLVQQLIGLEAKMRQYEDGERFVAAVEAVGGPELLGLAWSGPDALPTLDEIPRPAELDAPRQGEVSPIFAELLSRCAFPPPRSALTCAVSGGADSLALLALATEAGCAVTAVHVDHGLRGGSAGEAAVVEAAARRFGARFRAEQLALSPGPNLEARARAARLAVLPADVATGHTADDQAETMVLNLLRGAAAGGLGGMRVGRRHPILGLRRGETVAVCRHLGLTPVLDPSNEDPAHRRNRVRHEVMPLLDEVAQRDVVPVLTRQAALLADEADYLDSLAAGIDPTDARALARAPVALARRAVRTWLRGDGPYAPTADAVERVLDVARGGGRACEVGAGLRVRRSRGRLALEGAPHDAAVPVADAP